MKSHTASISAITFSGICPICEADLGIEYMIEGDGNLCQPEWMATCEHLDKTAKNGWYREGGNYRFDFQMKEN